MTTDDIVKCLQKKWEQQTKELKSRLDSKSAEIERKKTCEYSGQFGDY